jgi:NADH-quinone oxidoreductase subunit E
MIVELERINEIIDCYGAEQMHALAILQDIQREYNFLPRKALEQTAQRLGVPEGEIYRMATFFKSFSLHPKGEYECKVCLGTACHVLGGPRILESLERELGIKAGETTPDGKFSLEAVRCLGACALGPVVVVNEEPYAHTTPDRAVKLVRRIAAAENEMDGAGPPEETHSARSAADTSSAPPSGWTKVDETCQN